MREGGQRIMPEYGDISTGGFSFTKKLQPGNCYIYNMLYLIVHGETRLNYWSERKKNYENRTALYLEQIFFFFLFTNLIYFSKISDFTCMYGGHFAN